MKRNEKTIVIISALLTILATIILFTPHLSSTLKTILEIGLTALFAIIANNLLKPHKANRSYARIATKTVAIILIAALIVSFNVGLVVGFTRTLFPPSFEKILYGILPTIGIIIVSEFLRKIIVGSAYENKLMLTLITIALIIVGLSVETHLATINSVESAFIVTCTAILPVVAEGLLSTYLMKRAGMMPALVYRLTRGLYLYLLPIAPAFSQYLYSVLWLVIPYLVYYLARHDLPDEIVKQGGKIDKSKNNVKRNLSIITVPILVFLITLTVLVSGLFRYKMIAVASGSMSPIFDRGDAVIYDKESSLEPGDVMAFMHGGEIITHRIIDIKKDGKKKVYYTKGDANPTADNYEVMESLVLGKVTCIIKYVGFPTVWFNEAIGNL